jgi:hypothetical protein
MRGIISKNFLSGMALLIALVPYTAQAADPIGEVKNADGPVTVERGGSSQPIALGDHVFQSDVIVTAAGGSVGITFIDNSMMSLGPDSRLVLDNFRFDTTTHEGAFDSSLQKGTLAVKSGQIVKQTPEAMHIKTPAALLGVRGTEFVVRAEAKN